MSIMCDRILSIAIYSCLVITIVLIYCTLFVHSTNGYHNNYENIKMMKKKKMMKMKKMVV